MPATSYQVFVIIFRVDELCWYLDANLDAQVTRLDPGVHIVSDGMSTANTTMVSKSYSNDLPARDKIQIL